MYMRKYCVTYIKYQSYFCMNGNDDDIFMLYRCVFERRFFHFKTLKENKFMKISIAF